MLAVLGWLGSAHHLNDIHREFGLLKNAVGGAVFTGFLMWLLYLALEPTARARWPQALVTWNRLLAGQFGDAQLGSHVLVGAVIGLGLRIFLESLGWIDYRRDGVPLGNSLDGSEAF